MSELSIEEKARYARHLSLAEIGIKGQLRLKQSKVLVIGAGGLGAPLLLYLAAAGVGTIGIVDGDRVSSSNLQRQVLFDTTQIGMLKVEAARHRLLSLNPFIDIRIHPVFITRHNALELMAEYDIVADGSDNFPTRYLVNDACVLSGKPYVYGAIFRFEGQVSVFNALLAEGNRGPNYRDLFPTPPAAGQIPNCEEAGVLGVLPGIVGALQANEVIKLITGVGNVGHGKLAIFDASTLNWYNMSFTARPDNMITALIDYESFCGMPAREGVPSISWQTLLRWENENKSFQLLDVRTKEERQRQHIGGTHIPLDQIADYNIQMVDNNLPTIIYCQTGRRSHQATQLLMSMGLQQVFNLEGGIQQIPPSFLEANS
ncbi:MAG: molybdopterin-synthase adenylyltransferase MoeB [Saprospiraceae bacterium]